MWWVVNATPRPLYPREGPGSHCIGGRVGLRTGLDGCGQILYNMKIYFKSLGGCHHIRLRKFQVVFGSHKTKITLFSAYIEFKTRFRPKKIKSKTRLLKRWERSKFYSVSPLCISPPCTPSSCLSVPPLVLSSSPSYSTRRYDTAVRLHEGPRCVSAVIW